MSAILSADDLNDFITPGVACIKPVESVPTEKSIDVENAYEVTKEDTTSTDNAPPAQISLTDCLACSGCVTSAEAVLISLQSHAEVLATLDKHPSISDSDLLRLERSNSTLPLDDSKIFVASVSPQTRASLAAVYNISEQKAGILIEELLRGPLGLRSGGKYRSGFSWVVDTNPIREACLALGRRELDHTSEASTNQSESPIKKPILSSACPGWICYVEKTHAHIIPHLSKVKSPQALMGTLFKSSLSRQLGIRPDRIWHLAIMPCFDKKLEASREELADIAWNSNDLTSRMPSRDVDCVITTKELLMLADSRGIDLRNLARELHPPPKRLLFPDAKIDSFLYSSSSLRRSIAANRQAGTSGGYLHYMLRACQNEHAGSLIRVEQGRNADVVEYSVVKEGQTLLRTARYYGFRNIQNLVRKLKPVKQSRMPGAKAISSRRTQGPVGTDYAYVEVMACPGGCSNGGGQIKSSDRVVAEQLQDSESTGRPLYDQKQWLSKVDEAYYSNESEDEVFPDAAGTRSFCGNGPSATQVWDFLEHWAASVQIDIDRLAFTTFRAVESDVGKSKVSETERVVALSSKAGGGW